MTVPAATFQEFQTIGNREDLESFIYSISPTDTPFMSACDKTKADYTKHEWQTYALAAASATNAQIEGDDFANTTVTPTVRLNNYAQLSWYSFGVSGTQQALNHAGVKDEMAYQLLNYGKRLKRDMESQLTQNKASSVGGTGSARTSGSLESWLSTNFTTMSSATSAASPGFSSTGVVAPTDATIQVTVTEANVKSIIRQCYTAGGKPTIIMSGPFQRTKLAGFAGVSSTQFQTQTGGKLSTIVAGADAYASDFGTLRLVINLFSRERTVHVLDMDYWAIAYLRKFERTKLAKTGDADRMALLSEYTLVSRNEAASGKVVDCTSS